MAAGRTVLTWWKRGSPGEGRGIDFSDELRGPDGLQLRDSEGALVTIVRVDASYFEHRTAPATVTTPEVWADITDQVSFASVQVVDGLFAQCAVGFRLLADADASPAGGGVYRVLFEVTLSNGDGEVVAAPIRIPPSAAIV